MKKYIVTLTVAGRRALHEPVARGKAAAQKLAHARILLKADAAGGGPAWPDGRIAEALEVSVATIGRVRRRFVERGTEAALVRKKQGRPGRERALDGRAEARLIALACSSPPDGRKAWTMRPLADELVELEVVPTISDETVRRPLKKRTEAAPQGAVVPPAGGRRRVRGGDGGRAGGPSPALRRGPAAGLPGRGEQAARRRGDRADPGGPRPAGAVRPRICPRRDGRPAHGGHAAAGPAVRARHRATDGRGCERHFDRASSGRLDRDAPGFQSTSRPLGCRSIADLGLCHRPRRSASRAHAPSADAPRRRRRASLSR